MDLPTVPYHPTPPEKARELLELAELREGEVLFDLGCGKGNILIVAAEEFGARCVGIEKDSELVRQAREEVERRGLSDRVEVIHGDIFSREFWAHLGGEGTVVRDADVVAIYLNFEMHEVLKPMLEKELREGARVASFEFFVRGWEVYRERPMLFVFKKGHGF
ncbi:MAG: methyltransferase domain-containing protein [Euryarchaeota archaeon]|nr:methyltransferase domain-containing protein [Euryarchaeota archaeon]